MPTTLRTVSCWPAKEASGRSSAVALERTANETPAGESFVRRAKCSRMAFSRSGGKAASLTQLRISAPAWARAFTSSVLRVARRALMRSVSRLWSRKSRKASAVVAKPPGTWTPDAESWLISSPSEAFLPPTTSTSVMRSSSNGMTSRPACVLLMVEVPDG